MTILLMMTRGVLLISVILYIYFFSRRKQHDVATKLWLIIIVGILVGVVSRLIEVNLGISTWSSIQISVYFSLALFSYCLWKLSLELKNGRH